MSCTQASNTDPPRPPLRKGGSKRVAPAVPVLPPVPWGGRGGVGAGSGGRKPDQPQGGPRVNDEIPPQVLQDDDLAAVERLKDAFAKLKGELAKVIVGQHAVLEELL